jgi:hypothetical protein
MKEITIELQSNDHLWDLLDKSLNAIYIYKFNPNEALEWWKTNITVQGTELKNISVRQMEFDINTDLAGLKTLLGFNTYHMSIYQFDNPVPDTLNIDRLPEHSRLKILKQNGLHHIFFVHFEFVTIHSFDEDFIKGLDPKQI